VAARSEEQKALRKSLEPYFEPLQARDTSKMRANLFIAKKMGICD